MSDYSRVLSEHDRESLRSVLESCGKDEGKAASAIGVHRTTLVRALAGVPCSRLAIAVIKTNLGAKVDDHKPNEVTPSAPKSETGEPGSSEIAGGNNDSGGPSRASKSAGTGGSRKDRGTRTRS